MPSRRDFLKTAPAAAGALALAAHGTDVEAAEKPSPAAAPVHPAATPYTPVADYPIQPAPYWNVVMRDAFWKPKIDRNAAVTIPFEAQKLSGAGFGVRVLEAAIWSLRTHPNATLQTQIEPRIRALAAAQNGNNNFEVSAAYFQTTGKRDLIDAAIKAAETLRSTFATSDPPFSGGERDALNCVQLYRVTHDKTHLDLAKHYLDIRGRADSVNRSRHNQSYKPVLEQGEAVGHAVNCASLMVSLTDVGVLTGLKPYVAAAQRMWRDAVEKKMYVTGGIGSTGNEGFGEPYDLPNISAYAETCAVLMFITLNHRLFLATGDSRYIDVMERGMYNNALSGVSTSGDHFFYVNRLSSAGDGRDLRWDHASLECCPPNLIRFLATMPGYMYAQGPTGAMYVNLYASSESTFTVGAKKLTLSAKSDMPWGGKTTIAIADAEAAKGAIKLRVPGWARGVPVPGGLYTYANPAAKPPTVFVNSARVTAVADPFGYITVDRVWKSGDAVEITFDTDVRRVRTTRVKDARRHTAVERGPIVYAAEWPDIDGGKVWDAMVPADAPLTPAVEPSAFDGVTVIKTVAGSVTTPNAHESTLTLVPYHLWANRGAGEMAVWLPDSEFAAGDVGPAGGFIFYVNPKYRTDGWRYLEAAPFDQSAGATWGCFRKMIDGARGTAIGTGRQNTADMIAACTEHGTAANLCASLNVNGVRGWFLPSRDELALMYKALAASGAGNFITGGVRDNFTYWASSQQTADMAAHIDFADLGRQHGDDKDFPRRVRAIRAI